MYVLGFGRAFAACIVVFSLIYCNYLVDIYNFVGAFCSFPFGYCSLRVSVIGVTFACFRVTPPLSWLFCAVFADFGAGILGI